MPRKIIKYGKACYKEKKHRYACYEQGITGIYTGEELEHIYEERVDKKEYPDYEGWMWDMIRTGVFEKF